MNRGRLNPRILLAIVIAAVLLLSYFGHRVINLLTKEAQRISMTVPQEIALGLQAAPEMAKQYGGLHPSLQAREDIRSIGHRLVSKTAARLTKYQFDFHLLADPQTVNAFALPGGQVFLTEGLRTRLASEGQLAGMLGHEIGHIVARHSAERIAKAQLTEGLTGAVAIATYDPNDPPSRNTAMVAAMIGQVITMRFGPEDELESDKLGVRFMSEAGYDPRSMIAAMEALEEAARGPHPPEFFGTHPNPERRIERIKVVIEEQFPNGVPDDLTK
jgi:beta-barrel assembly-enhancing protease